jgi:hypothetical protein
MILLYGISIYVARVRIEINRSYTSRGRISNKESNNI